MSSVLFFEKISIEPPYKKIYSRLGFKKKTTELSLQQKKETDVLIEKAVELIALKGCALKAAIVANDGEKVIIEEDLIFPSTGLARFLHDCPEMLLMGASAGGVITEAIAADASKGNFSRAVVYDATASEMTDCALDWIAAYFGSFLRREGKSLLPRRFSAGYADFGLENQGKIHERLEMQKIGVAINSQFLLLPEKSVTAITGVCR